MRPPADYTLMHDLPIPGTYAAALRAGDEITEQGRVAAGLVVGIDVLPLRDDVLARPGDDDPRAAWQDYAVVRGVPYDEAVNLDAAELRTRVDAEPEGAREAAMPETGDRKNVWQDFAVTQIVGATGGKVDAGTARDRISPLTKAELMEVFGPDAQDPDTDESWAYLWAVPGQVEQGGPHGDIVLAATPEPDRTDRQVDPEE
jgi:hypothetical protein